jgi:hypothetical protein
VSQRLIGSVSGHDFSRAVKAVQRITGFTPEKIYLIETEDVAAILLSPQGLKAFDFTRPCGTTEVVP